MSETTTTIVKLITSLATPKASTKYFFVALGIIFSWKYISPLIKDIGIPEEHVAISVLLLGLGVGTLTGHCITSAAAFLWRLYKNKIKVQGEEAKRQDIINKVIFKFKNSFPHFTSYQKSILRELTKKDEAYDLGWPDVKALHEGKYIEMLSHITQHKCLFRINPLLTDIVVQFYQDIVKSCTADFLSNMDEDFEELLILLESEGKKSEKKVSRGAMDCHENLFFSNCISMQNEVNGFWLYFNEDYKEEFEKQTGKAYMDEVFIKSKQIKS